MQGCHFVCPPTILILFTKINEAKLRNYEGNVMKITLRVLKKILTHI